MSSLVIKYSELFTLYIEQLYYQNKICSQYKTDPVLDFTIVPTPECRIFMQKLDFIFKNTNNTGGFVVLARTMGLNAGGNNVLRFKPRIEHKLSFFIYLKNPAMLNFNELPTDISGEKIYYFNNLITDTAALRTDLHLTANATGVNGAADTLKKSNEIYRYHSLVPVVPDTAKVKHMLTGAEVKPKSLINNAGQADLIFELSSLPLGYCQFMINNVKVDDFYYLGKSTDQKVFGVIELFLSGTVAPNYRIVEADYSIIAQRPVYGVSFKNRQTFWRYHINLETSSPLYLEMAALTPAEKIDFINRLNIENTDNSILFTRTPVDDRNFIFETNTPHALQEKYISSNSLTLYKNIGVDKKPVKSNLRYPDPLNMDASGNPIIRSDIFMTI